MPRKRGLKSALAREPASMDGKWTQRPKSEFETRLQPLVLALNDYLNNDATTITACRSLSELMRSHNEAGPAAWRKLYAEADAVRETALLPALMSVLAKHTLAEGSQECFLAACTALQAVALRLGGLVDVPMGGPAAPAGATQRETASLSSVLRTLLSVESHDKSKLFALCNAMVETCQWQNTDDSTKIAVIQAVAGRLVERSSTTSIPDEDETSNLLWLVCTSQSSGLLDLTSTRASATASEPTGSPLQLSALTDASLAFASKSANKRGHELSYARGLAAAVYLHTGGPLPDAEPQAAEQDSESQYSYRADSDILLVARSIRSFVLSALVKRNLSLNVADAALSALQTSSARSWFEADEDMLLGLISGLMEIIAMCSGHREVSRQLFNALLVLYYLLCTTDRELVAAALHVLGALPLLLSVLSCGEVTQPLSQASSAALCVISNYVATFTNDAEYLPLRIRVPYAHRVEFTLAIPSFINTVEISLAYFDQYIRCVQLGVPVEQAADQHTPPVGSLSLPAASMGLAAAAQCHLKWRVMCWRTDPRYQVLSSSSDLPLHAALARSTITSFTNIMLVHSRWLFSQCKSPRETSRVMLSLIPSPIALLDLIVECASLRLQRGCDDHISTACGLLTTYIQLFFTSEATTRVAERNGSIALLLHVLVNVVLRRCVPERLPFRPILGSQQSFGAHGESVPPITWYDKTCILPVLCAMCHCMVLAGRNIDCLLEAAEMQVFTDAVLTVKPVDRDTKLDVEWANAMFAACVIMGNQAMLMLRFRVACGTRMLVIDKGLEFAGEAYKLKSVPTMVVADVDTHTMHENSEYLATGCLQLLMADKSRTLQQAIAYVSARLSGGYDAARRMWFLPPA